MATIDPVPAQRPATAPDIRLRDIGLAFACGFVLPAALLGGAFYLIGGTSLEPSTADGVAAQIGLSVGVLYGIFLVAIHRLVLRRRGIGWQAIGFRSVDWRWYAAAFALLALWSYGSVLIYQGFAAMDDATRYQRAALLPRGVSWFPLLLIAIAIGPIAALLEETLFRGVLFRWLRQRSGLLTATLASAALFAAVHFNYLQPGGVAGLLMTAEIFAIGACLALLVEKSGSLWPGILVHAVNNLGVLAYLALT